VSHPLAKGPHGGQCIIHITDMDDKTGDMTGAGEEEAGVPTTIDPDMVFVRDRRREIESRVALIDDARALLGMLTDQGELLIGEPTGL